jgi:hypothetical protein
LPLWKSNKRCQATKNTKWLNFATSFRIQFKIFRIVIWSSWDSVPVNMVATTRLHNIFRWHRRHLLEDTLWILGEMFYVCKVLTAANRNGYLTSSWLLLLQFCCDLTMKLILQRWLASLGLAFNPIVWRWLSANSDRRTTTSNLFVIESCLLTHWVDDKSALSTG